MSRSRYAIYFAPAPTTPLWRLASAVIGRDAATGETPPPPAAAPCDGPDWAARTAEPRRYGFHATLKAPFELAEGADEAMLVAAAEAFAAARTGFAVDDLAVDLLGDFVALRPRVRIGDLDRLAADCVVAFEPFRAALDARERARRLGPDPNPARIEAVDRWGYAHVFEHFRFHMTLTGPLAAEECEPTRAALARLLGEVVARPMAVSAIAIFHQGDRAGPFHLLNRCPFGA